MFINDLKIQKQDSGKKVLISQTHPAEEDGIATTAASQ
jgi:hypothetical protein